MKTCTKCNLSKDEDEFAWKNKASGIKSSECKPCHRIMRGDFYKRNKQSEINRAAKRRKNVREFIDKLKLKLCCQYCDQNHPATLQFHHIDPSKKTISIAKIPTRGWSFVRIKSEMDKCIVLCANCHAIEHSKYNSEP